MTLRSTLFAAASALVLSVGAAAALPATAETPLNLRAGPGIRFPVVGTVPPGATVDVRGCVRGWCRVRFHGERGFARRGQLAMAGRGRVAVVPGYAYEEPYDDYYSYGYGPSVGFAFGGRDRFHHRGDRGWDRGRVGTWAGGHRWSGAAGGTWSGGRTGFTQGGRTFTQGGRNFTQGGGTVTQGGRTFTQGGGTFTQGGRNFQGGNIGGRAAVNAPTGMPSGNAGGFRGGAPMGGGASGGGAHIGGGAMGGGAHVGGGAMGGGGRSALPHH